MVPWSEGKFLAWDVTCVDSFCLSHRQRCSTEAGTAAAFAEGEKVKKHSYSFQPIAFETSGSIGPDSMSFLKDLGCRIKMVTGEPQLFSFLMQRLSVAIQTGNAILVLRPLRSPDLGDYILIIIIIIIFIILFLCVFVYYCYCFLYCRHLY